MITNDLHHFAGVVADALFVAPDVLNLNNKAQEKFIAAFECNRGALESVFAGRLRAERKAISEIRDTGKWKDFFRFSVDELSLSAPAFPRGLGGLAAYERENKRFPYCLVSAYFSGAYFGLQQAIELDSIRYAIDQMPSSVRPRLLAALVQSASHCSSTSGHFAQYLVVRDERTAKYIARIRSRSVRQRFVAALESFPVIPCLDRSKNRVFRKEAISLLKNHVGKLSIENLVIYADPPYSRAQYSRYYHVLETLVLYDYPACDSKGRYRAKRFKTDFSRKLGVVDAMTEFVRAASETGAPLYISYPRNGILQSAGANLRDILKQYYNEVRLAAHEPLNHSTLGGAPGAASVEVLEDVYYAGWK